MKLKKYGIPLVAVILLCALDQITKRLAVHFLMGKSPVVLWDGVFELQYVENRGAAFGIFQNQQIIFYILTLVIAALLLWFYSKIPEERKYLLLKIPVIVCFAGAIGNFIDRVAHGYVVDFFYFKLIDFPVFNVADIYITCSAVLFLILFFFKYKEDDFKFLSRKKEAAPSAGEEKNHDL
ncbi:MAG TPA: signal peptidase II [Candidatus Scybalocola faecavium]|nr:signal peptidase II [Candidatus Scybalocola faecavium]